MAAAMPGRRSVLGIALLLLSGCSFTAAQPTILTALGNDTSVLCQAEGAEFTSSNSELICSLDTNADAIASSKLADQCPESVPDDADALLTVAFRSLPNPCFKLQITRVQPCSSSDEPVRVRFVVLPPATGEVCVQRIVPGLGGVLAVSGDLCDNATCNGVELIQEEGTPTVDSREISELEGLPPSNE